MGTILSVFGDPTLHGAGFVVAFGLVLVGVALLVTMWWGVIGERPTPVLPGRLAASGGRR